MNLNFSVLPFYDSLEEQNSKKNYAYGDVYPLYMPKGVILPFQIFNINIGVYSTSHRWWLINANTTQATDITSAMDNYISIVAISTTKENIIFFNENTLILPSISIGRYYLRLDLNYGSLYSDIITFVNNSDNYIFLEWNNIKNLDCEVGTIVYELQEDEFFKNRLYLTTELGKPDYVLTEEGEERNGYFFPIKQISEKTYKFNFLSCEYLLDVLRLIHLADYINVLDIHKKSYSANEFKIEYEWQEQGNLAAVTATFQTEAVIKKIAATIDIVKPDYINLNMFHAVVPAVSTKSVTFEYPYNVNTDNLNFAGVVDNNGHIEVWKDANENYYIINPTNSMMYTTTLLDFLYNYIVLESAYFTSAFDTSNVTNMSNMFYRCNRLTTIDISNFDTSNVTNMSNMFARCNRLTTLDISNFDTSNVKDMQIMFYLCSALTTLNISNFDTSNVTNMYAMFQECTSLTALNISNFNTSNVTNMSDMFYQCSALTTLNISNFDTSNVTNMSYMFYRCNRLTTIDISNFDTSNVTNMSNMFARCNRLTTIDISNFNTSNVKDMQTMFYLCSALTTLNISNFDTSNVTNMYAMFQECTSLTVLNISNFNTSNVTNMSYMFYQCNRLTTIISATFILKANLNSNSMFYHCLNLVGGNGTTYNIANIRAAYARIDGENNLPGYFTAPS